MIQALAKVVETVAGAAKEAVGEVVKKGSEPAVSSSPEQSSAKLSDLRTPSTNKAFITAQLPFILNQVNKLEEDVEEELDGRGDLLQLELKQHLSQLKTPGLSVKKKARYGQKMQGRESARQISTVVYEKIRSLLHVFPWFYNFIKGVIILRSTKQS